MTNVETLRRGATADGAAGVAARYSNRWWVLAILTLVYVSGFIDRIAMGVLGQSIKLEFGLADWQLGVLNGIAFSLTYTILGVPFARLSERRSRVNIIAIAAAVWSAMTALTGAAANFVQLVLFRAAVGVGEAGATAPSQALISDYFPPQRRGLALSIYHLGIPVGVIVGGTFGGWAAQTWGWRAAFVVLALPGLLGALLLKLTVREPRRGMSDPEPRAERAIAPFGEVLGAVLRSPLVLNVSAAMALGIMANAAVKAFTVPYLMRHFDVSLGQAASAFGLFTGGAAIIGTVAGGWLADFLARRNPAWLCWVPGASLLMGGPCYVIALHQGSVTAALAWLSLGAMLMYGYLAPGFAAVHNRTPPSMRATVTSLILLVQSLVGFGLGPVLVGAASDVFSQRSFTGGVFAEVCKGAALTTVDACRETSASALGSALSLLIVLYLWAALHFYIAGRRLRSSSSPT